MLTAFLPWVVLAQVAQPAPTTQPTDDLEKQLGQAIAADQAAAPPKPAAPTVLSATPQGSPLTSALLNPEISVIGSFVGSARRDGSRDPSFRSGDDPLPAGLAIQELELSFAADVDPYFKLRAFLTMPGGEGIEVEEAFLETTSLPRGVGLKVGAFRSSFGRNNEQHLHVQDFARRPRTTQLLGDDGLRAPGAQLSYLLPLPWYASLFVEALDPAGSGDLTGTAGLEQFFDLGTSWSLYTGLSAATLARAKESDTAPAPAREYLGGGDVYLKWKPPNETDTYAWVAFTAEYVASRTSDKDWDGVAYGQLVAQVDRRVRLGARVDLVGYPRTGLTREVVASASVAFLPTEFSRLRLTYAHDAPIDGGVDQDSVFLQVEGTIGAHGAHPF
jgi:hypothetical protein